MKRFLRFCLVVVMSMMMVSPVMAKEERTIDHFYSDADDEVNLNADVKGSSALAGEKVNLKSDMMHLLPEIQ